jgi:hypothetical protein
MDVICTVFPKGIKVVKRKYKNVSVDIHAHVLILVV